MKIFVRSWYVDRQIWIARTSHQCAVMCKLGSEPRFMWEEAGDFRWCQFQLPYGLCIWCSESSYLTTVASPLEIDLTYNFAKLKVRKITRKICRLFISLEKSPFYSIPKFIVSIYFQKYVCQQNIMKTSIKYFMKHMLVFINFIMYLSFLLFQNMFQNGKAKLIFVISAYFKNA